MAYEIKELSIGGILDQAIRIVKDHFGVLFGIIAVAYLPAIVAVGLAARFMLPKQPMRPTTNEEMRVYGEQMQVYLLDFARVWIVLGPIVIVTFLVVLPLTNAALTHAIANFYLGKPVTIGSAFSSAFKLILPLLVVSFLFWLAYFVGFLLCGIGALVACYWFWFSTQVVVVEGITGTAALSRSKQIIKGSLGPFLVITLLVFIIQAAIGGVAGLIPQPYLAVIAQQSLSAIMFAFGTAVYVVFYFSCRCKNENFDLTMLADSVAQQET